MVSRTPSQEIVRAIRKRIVAGEFPPGAQLPTWDVLGDEYDVARNTLVRVIAQLKQQRFIYSSSTRGMFVVDKPPHLHDYALLFHGHPGRDQWSLFWSVLTECAAELETLRDCRIHVKYGVRDEHDNEPRRRLLEELAADQYAGLIIVGQPERIAPEVLDMPDLPKVVILGKSEQVVLPQVDIDRESFVSKSIRWLKARGRKRVAVISACGHRVHDLLAAAVRAEGFEHHPQWSLTAPVEHPAAVEPIVRLLLWGAQPQLPDALIVSNDNLASPALAAVLAMGKRVPQDLEILTHCNWPTRQGHVVPAARLGYDVRDVVRRSVEIIDAWRAGQEFSRVVRTPALFEDEVAGVPAAGN